MSDETKTCGECKRLETDDGATQCTYDARWATAVDMEREINSEIAKGKL